MTDATLDLAVIARERAQSGPPASVLQSRPHLEVSIADGAVGIKLTAQDNEALRAIFASSSPAFVDAQISNLINASGGDLNAAVAFVAGLSPRNEVETALAVQMYASHIMAIEMMTRAKGMPAGAGALSEIGNLATKAQRTFVAQIEALAKLRTGGKQIVEHRHYNIDNRGGQAVVAENVNVGGAGHGK